MTRQSLWLRVFCGWIAFVFIVLLKNMITDTEHTAAFRLVHSSIAVVSLALAAGAWPIAKRLETRGRAEKINQELVGGRSDAN